MNSWHVIYTKPRFEKKVTERLKLEAFEAYCPLIHTLKQWSDRKKHISLPMFPSYVFLFIEEKDRNRVLQIPGVLKFVYWLGKPALISEREIEAIKKIELSGSQISVVQKELSEGDALEISEGIFKGLSGFVDRKRGRKLIVFLKELNMKISFDLA